MQRLADVDRKLNKNEKPVEKVLRSLNETISISQQVTATLRGLMTSTESQTRSTEEVAKTIQSISAATQHTATSVSKAMQRATSSDSIAKSAGSDAQKAMQKMNDVKEIITRSSHSIKDLGAELEKIQDMVKLITGISEKTNLLALNAAIEAARAGTAGKGFAVVAEEVKRLAENSRKGAGEISEIVKHLEESSDASIKAIEQGNTSIMESYGVVEKVLGSLKEIATAVSEIVSEMSEISSAAEQVAASSEQAAASGEEILSVAQDNLANLRKVVSSNDNKASAIESIVSDTHNATTTLVEITGIMDKSNIISITDTEGSITYMNDKFIEVARYRPEELFGQNHRILKSGFHAPELFEAMWKTVSAGRPFAGYVRNRAKDGSIYWVKAVISPVFDDKGKITGYVSVRAPVTELMVLLGVEDAVKNAMKGKKIDKNMKEIVERLKYGRYDVSDNCQP